MLEGKSAMFAFGQILTDSVAEEAIDPSLALLQVNGVSRQIPVDNFPAVSMEVQALLADRSRGQHEGPKR